MGVPHLAFPLKYRGISMAAPEWQQANGVKKCENGRPKTVRNRRPSSQGPLNGGVSNGEVSRSGLVLPFLSFFVLLCPFGTFPGIFPICPGTLRGFSRLVLFLFLGLLSAPTRNSPERVPDTIWTIPEKSGKPPGLEIPGLASLNPHPTMDDVLEDAWSEDDGDWQGYSLAEPCRDSGTFKSPKSAKTSDKVQSGRNQAKTGENVEK